MVTRMTEERFDDQEVSLILRRALEADEARDGRGLTLAELKEIAAEVGISPDQVETAALSVQAERRVPRGGRIRTTSRYEVSVNGEIRPESRPELLRAIRRALGRHGIVTDEMGGLQWQARDYFGGRYVTVHSEEGRTRVEALGNFRDGAFVSAGGGGTLGMAAVALAAKFTVGGLSALGAVGLPILAAGVALPAWAFYRHTFAREDRALRQAVADIAARVESTSTADAESLSPSEPSRAPARRRGGSSPEGADPPPR